MRQLTKQEYQILKEKGYRIMALEQFTEIPSSKMDEEFYVKFVMPNDIVITKVYCKELNCFSLKFLYEEGVLNGNDSLQPTKTHKYTY